MTKLGVFFNSYKLFSECRNTLTGLWNIAILLSKRTKRFSFLKYFFSIISESIYKIIASATNLNKFNQKHNSYAFSVQNTSTSCIPTFIPLSCQLHSTYLNLSTKKDKYEKKLGKRSIIFLTSLSIYYEIDKINRSCHFITARDRQDEPCGFYAVPYRLASPATEMSS